MDENKIKLIEESILTEHNKGKEIIKQLREMDDKIYNLVCDLVKEKYNVYEGKIVFRNGVQFKVESIKRKYNYLGFSIMYRTKQKPWLVVRKRKKDGGWSKNTQTIDDWTLPILDEYDKF